MFIFLLKNKSYGMLGGLHIEMVTCKWCILPLGGVKLMLLLCIDLFLLCTFRLNRLSTRVHVHHIVYTYERTLSFRTILTRPWISVECYYLFLASKQVKMTLFFSEMCIDCVSCSNVAFSDKRSERATLLQLRLRILSSEARQILFQSQIDTK